MASEITHVALADKIYDTHFSHLDKKEFYVGLIFPDIKHLKVVSRDKLHPYLVNLDEIKKDSSFLAGIKYHALTDSAREHFLVSKKIYELAPPAPITRALKLFEDDLFYNKVNNWHEIANYFDEVLEEEKEFGIPIEKIQLWHKMTREYLSVPPSDETRLKFLLNVEPKEKIDELNEEIALIRNNQKIIDIDNALYDSWEEIITSRDVWEQKFD